MDKKFLYPILLGIIFFSVYAFSFDSKLDFNGDNAVYLELAQNISAGHGYTQMSIEGEYIPASHFPPGYSSILAVFMALGINNLIFFKILNGIFLFMSLFLIYEMIKGITKNRVLAFCTILIPMFVPQLLRFSSIVMSEMFFLFLTVFSIFSLFKYTKSVTPFLKSPWFYSAIISMVIAYHVRTAAIAGLLAILVFFLLRKEWKQVMVATGGILLLSVPWAVRNAMYGIDSRYFGTIMTVNPWRPEQGSISSIGEMIEKMIQNFDETVIVGFKDLLFPFASVDYNGSSGIVSVIIGLFIVAIIVYGIWSLGEMKWVFLSFLFGNIGLFMLWHGGNDSRYVVPISPIIIVCFYVGIYFLCSDLFFKKTKNIEKRPIFLKVLPFLFCSLLFLSFPKVKRYAKIAKQPYATKYTNYISIMTEMGKNLPEGTVCYCRKPEFFSYYAPSIRAACYPFSTVPEDIIQSMIDKNVEYVIADQLGYTSAALYLSPTIEKYKSLFQTVLHYRSPNTYLFRFEREKAIQLLQEKSN